MQPVGWLPAELLQPAGVRAATVHNLQAVVQPLALRTTHTISTTGTASAPQGAADNRSANEHVLPQLANKPPTTSMYTTTVV